MYLSPNWNEERYGETIFVEELKDVGGKPQNYGNMKYNTLSKASKEIWNYIITPLNFLLEVLIKFNEFHVM